MNKNKIYFIYMPTPVLGRYPLQGINGAGIFGRLFGLHNEDDYITALNNHLSANYPAWVVERDNTESDIEKLMAQDAALLVCAPGLKFQFYTGRFNKKRVIHLSMMEFSNNDVLPVINKIKEINNEGQTQNYT